MSTIDTKCYTISSELQSGAGEMSCMKQPPTTVFSPVEPNNLGQNIASEIMNEIFDNAVDIAMSNIYRTTNPQRVERISPDMVGDILENIMASGSAQLDETGLLDDKIKKIINEMKYPVTKEGIGDQPPEETVNNKVKVLQLPDSKCNTLERKNRLTNLVRNSKYILTKFVKSEVNNRLKSSKSEETLETVIRTIDLEAENAKSCKMAQSCSRTSPGTLHFPIEYTMDIIDLSENQEMLETGAISMGKRNKVKLNLKTRILQFFKLKKATSNNNTPTKSPRQKN